MPQTVSQPTLAPTRKVASGVLVGAPSAIVVIWLAKTYGGADMPVEVAGAFGVLFSQVVSYFTKERA